MGGSWVYFYCPSEEIVGSVPERTADYWSWINEVIPNCPARTASGQVCDWHGPYSWTIQTWMHLREHGYACRLVSTIPDEGIIVSHSDFWDSGFTPSAGQYLVEMKPDRVQSLQQSHFTIVQSPCDPFYRDLGANGGNVRVVDYWPQPNIVRRDHGRGHVVRRAFFSGNHPSFSPSVKDVRAKLRKVGIEFEMRPRRLWHDYADADLAIAVRQGVPFSYKGAMDTYLSMKPASKLINAWLAEVPAILSPEPSFLALRDSELDFLPASNLEEIVAAATRLKEDRYLYFAMIENGRRRGVNFTAKAIVGQWVDLFEKHIIPAYAALRGEAAPT